MADRKPTNDRAGATDGERQLRVHVDERNLQTSYTNGFRTNATAEEVMLDFGVNLSVPASGPAGSDQANVPQVLFQVNNRLIMNYYTAKRLALSLGQVVQRHEAQFGEIKLNVTDRMTGKSN